MESTRLEEKPALATPVNPRDSEWRDRLVNESRGRNVDMYEGPHVWLWCVGAARITILLLIAAGASQFGAPGGLGFFLLGLYAVALGAGVAHLVTLKRARAVPLLLTWTQTLLDFGVVAATVSFTGGIYSPLAFLFVIVILEAGLLLGLTQGFLFATLALVFIAVQAAVPSVTLSALQGSEWVERWYRFVVQGLALYLTAFVSGYWNQRVRRMEQFQRNILNNMNSGFLMTDVQGLVIGLNRAGSEILDITEAHAVGKPVDQVLCVASGEECPVLSTLRSRRDFLSYEFFALTAARAAKQLGLTTSQIYDSRGHLTGIIASFTDLTEMARMRQELQSQDRLAAVGELAAGLAHEVRNPVAAIRGAVDELRSSLDSPQLVRKLAEIAIRESDHLNDIVTGFLNFARSPSLKRELFDLRDVVRDVADRLGHEQSRTGPLRIVAVLPEAPCPVSGSPTQIRQVLTNLGQNAIDAMQQRGTVTFTVTPSAASFEIRVDDEGPGIPPDKITRVFEPFYSEKERGVGMGLAICSRIVTAHDGTIRAGSRDGGGASMMVRLPAAQPKE